MKKFKFFRFGFVLMLIFVSAVLFSAACDGSNTDDYDVREWSDGTKVAVFKDESGAEQMMNYALFMMLMQQGSSMSNIRQYHHTQIVNSVEYRNQTKQYRSIKTPPVRTVRQSAPPGPIKTSAPSVSKPSSVTPKVSAPARPSSSSPARSSGKR